MQLHGIMHKQPSALPCDPDHTRSTTVRKAATQRAALDEIPNIPYRQPRLWR